MLLKGRPCGPWPGPAGAPGVRAWEWGGRWPRHVHPRDQGGPDRLRLELAPEVCAAAQAQAPGRRERSSESMFWQGERTWPRGRVGRSLEVVPQARLPTSGQSPTAPEERGAQQGRQGWSLRATCACWLGGWGCCEAEPPSARLGLVPRTQMLLCQGRAELAGQPLEQSPSVRAVPPHPEHHLPGRSRAPGSHPAHPPGTAMAGGGAAVLPAQGWAHGGSLMKGGRAKAIPLQGGLCHLPMGLPLTGLGNACPPAPGQPYTGHHGPGAPPHSQPQTGKPERVAEGGLAASPHRKATTIYFRVPSRPPGRACHDLLRGSAIPVPSAAGHGPGLQQESAQPQPLD